MKKIVIISVAFLFLVGCGLYEVRGKKYISLNDALARVREPYDSRYSVTGWVMTYLDDLRALRKQALSEEDKAIIDRKISEAEYSLRRAATYDERRIKQEIQQEREEKEKRERLKREQAERERIEFETKRKELIQNSNGTLSDKSAQQVKKLVDSWKEGSPSWRWLGEEWKKERAKFFSAETFYKVFGKPDKTQYLSEVEQVLGGGYYDVYYYYFLYGCKDGVVQIKVHAEQLDDNGIVIIEDLNIF